jgi:hypothetical protein
MSSIAKVFTGILGGGSVPKVSTAPATEDTEAVQEEARKQRLAAARARGRQSTLMTGGMGVTGSANTGRKTLLGQ